MRTALLLALALPACGSETTATPPPVSDAGDVGTVTPDAISGCAPWCRAVLPNASAVLKAVWGPSINDVWAVGIDGVIVHSDGKAWSNVASPTTSMLNSVWGTTGDDVWAVGAELLHYDGAAWSIVADAGTTSNKMGVWASAKNDAWYVTEKGEVGHFDGAKWTVTKVTDTVLWGVHGTSPTNVWLAASQGKTFRGGTGGFTELVAPVGTESITSVFVRGPDDVWAVGFHALVLHFTGGSFQVVRAPKGGGAFTWSVSATSATDVWLAGNNAFLQRYTGSEFKYEEPERLFDGHFQAVLAWPRDVLVVGEGAIFHLAR